MIYILEGEGVLEIDGEQAPLAHRHVHPPAARRSSTASPTPATSELRLLGVFTPAGSPAEAYYPDGTLAALPERD